jgi:RNA-directed DNA polymerase
MKFNRAFFGGESPILPESHSVATLETAEKNGTELLERILHRNNLNAAWKKVKDNKGAAGVDEMHTER